MARIVPCMCSLYIVMHTTHNFPFRNAVPGISRSFSYTCNFRVRLCCVVVVCACLRAYLRLARKRARAHVPTLLYNACSYMRELGLRQNMTFMHNMRVAGCAPCVCVARSSLVKYSCCAFLHDQFICTWWRNCTPTRSLCDRERQFCCC